MDKTLMKIRIRSTFAIGSTGKMKAEFRRDEDVTLEVEPGTTIKTMLLDLPSIGSASSMDDLTIHVFVNGKLKGFDYVLKQGDVIDLRIFQFTLMEIGNWVDADQSTGRVIKIPNGKVFTEMLANYSKGFQYIWNEIPVLITFESNWKRAKKILAEIAKKHAEHLTEKAAQHVREASARMMVFYTTLTPTVYTSVRDCGVLLTIRYLCKPRERRATEQAVWEDILTCFAECDDIDFAYPTVRRYNNPLEGKPGARAQLPSTPTQTQPDSED